MSRTPKTADRQPLNGSSNSADQSRLEHLDHEVDHKAEREGITNSVPASRSSRIFTIVGLCSVAAMIAAVLLTSERNGPGSQSLTAASPIAGDSADAAAGNCVATEIMPGGDNFYTPNAPAVENLGSGLVVQGTVRTAETCEPVRNARIQIWLNTARGGEGEPSNRGSVVTDNNGQYRLETSPVVSQFGQPHVHIAYDDGAYEPLFLRSVMESEDVPSFTVDFVLEPVDE